MGEFSLVNNLKNIMDMSLDEVIAANNAENEKKKNIAERLALKSNVGKGYLPWSLFT